MHPLPRRERPGQLADYVSDTMPEDDPSLVTGEAARQVAAYVHAAFYSPVARDRNRPARVELSRLTARQIRNAVADLVAGFRGGLPPDAPDGLRGLNGEYFRGQWPDPERLVFARVDPQVAFDFGLEGPDPEQFEPGRFTIRWTGSVVPPETGDYQWIVRTAHAVSLSVNGDADDPPLIDGTVRSGDQTEFRGTTFLLGGRAYPLTVFFSKAHRGAERLAREQPSPASIELLW
ncbi:MAG: hypothetical protein EBZ59_05350, partial [Planctomycetia bacterium]|nr:hypothetical protein [Planctomycetia bacterium]